MAKMKLICQSPPEYTPENVMSIRVKKAKVSQSVFASILNVSVSAVQKWESPSSGKHPSGAAAKLLQLIEKRGLEAIVDWLGCFKAAKNQCDDLEYFEKKTRKVRARVTLYVLF